MKYLKCYAPEWDELYQVEIDDSMAVPIDVAADLSDIQFAGIPLRPRSRSEANEQRYAERGSAVASK